MSSETAALARTRIEYLERLGDQLRLRGLTVQLSIPQTGPPSLHVVNPRATALAEHILAENSGDGWWFWWSWAERIARAGDLGEVADRVARVLAESGERDS
jgi:hypothetical protein